MFLFVGPVLPLPQLGVPLFLCKLKILLLGGAKHVGALCLVSCLRLLQHLIDVERM